MRTRYDGTDSLREEVVSLLDRAFLIPVCPEQMADLPTPRPSSEITDGDGRAVLEGKARVVDENGKDMTSSFLKGAHEVLDIALNTGAKVAIFKEKSPSCGVLTIKRKGQTVPGSGVTTALLKTNGIVVKGVK
jgi:uncharacterized protein YbbK (DUF523 family)